MKKTTVNTKEEEEFVRAGLKNFLLNIFLDVSFLFFFFRACSYRTPKSFACLRSLVSHQIKVYKVVNYRKIYHIDISHIAVQILVNCISCRWNHAQAELLSLFVCFLSLLPGHAS